MRSSTGIMLGLAAIWGPGCLSAGQGGAVGAVDVPDGISLDGGDTGDTAGEDTASGDTVAKDTTVDTADAGDTVEIDGWGNVCGNGVLEAEEACDDGNACDLDGCRAESCAPVPTVVLTELALDPTVAYDLDDADGDHDVTTGGDNRLGGSQLVTSVVNPLIIQSIELDQVIQLATFGGFDSAVYDPELTLALHPGVDPECPAQRPPTWLDEDGPSLLYSDGGAWQGCVPSVALDAHITPDRPSSSSPEGPVLVATSDAPVVIPAGTLGDLTVARSHLEAHVVGASGVLSVIALSDGQLSGVVPASALYRIDTSGLLPGCPTALHAVLALVGHIDQDTEGNGARDWIQFTLGGPQPCLGDPVTIVGCCNDGDCDDFVPGEACALDPRIADGYSAGFRFSARAAQVTAQVDGATWCGPQPETP